MDVELIRKDFEESHKGMNYEILDIEIEDNCGIVFIKHDKMIDDPSNFYKDLTRILYKQALI